MDNTQQIEIMIYRNNKLELKHALWLISRRISRVLMQKSYKVLEASAKGADDLVREFKKL